MKFDHSQKNLMEAIGINHKDLFFVLKEIGSLMVDSSTTKVSQTIESMEKETSLLNGEDKAKRMRVLHYLAYQQCETIAEKHLKYMMDELTSGTVSEVAH